VALQAQSDIQMVQGAKIVVYVLAFPFRAARWVLKWTLIGLIAFMIGMHWGR
jgi:hypothetical protein